MCCFPAWWRSVLQECVVVIKMCAGGYTKAKGCPSGQCVSLLHCLCQPQCLGLASICVLSCCQPHLCLSLPPCLPLPLLLSTSPVASVLWSSLLPLFPGSYFTIFLSYCMALPFICLLYQESVLLCNFGWLQTQLCRLDCFHTHSNISASVPQALRLQSCTTMPRWRGLFFTVPCPRLWSSL